MAARPSSKQIAIVSIAAAIAGPAAAEAAPAPPVAVALHQASGLRSSYFQLQARPGRQVSAGNLELRNLGGRSVTVLLDPIDAVTATTLGSAYDVRGLAIHGPARWTRLGRRRVVLAPHGATKVAVKILPPGRAQPGDYLSGIGVQAVGPRQRAEAHGNVAVASTQRYAVGLEVRLRGPRHPLIRFTGARVKRDPAGVAFSLLARNPGNVILKNVSGSALITQGRRVAARIPMGPGTFITGTSIAYPIPTPRERPREGTVYRVRAVLHYRGGIARLDTHVRFGRLDALRQQAFGGPKAHEGQGFPAWLAVIATLALAALGAALLWRRRLTGARSPLRTLDGALRISRASGRSLSLILVDGVPGEASRRVGSMLRVRLRRTDRLCRLEGRGFLVVAADTDITTADAIAADLRRHLEQAPNGCNGVTVEVDGANGDATAAELLERITHSNGAPEPTPTG